MESFLPVLLMTAVFQMAGGLLQWIALKRFGRHVSKVMIAEMAIMIIISAELLYFGIRASRLAVLGFAAGVVFVLLINRFAPHRHTAPFERLSYLVFIAMLMHELPEGMAFGSSYILDRKVGLLTAALVSLHNIPEGSIVAFPFLLRGRMMSAFRLLGLTQIIYILGGLLTYFLLFSLGRTAQVVFMCFAAGAMTFIALEELKFLKK